MSVFDDSGRCSCAPTDCALQTKRMALTIAATCVVPRRELRKPIVIAGTPLLFMSSATGDYVVRLHRRRLVPPAGALVAEDRGHLLIAELIGEGRHGGGVRHPTDALAGQPMQHGADVLGRI